MDRASYLAAVRSDPWGSFPSPSGSPEVPSGWIAEAWDLPEVQGTHAQDVVRSVSEVGELWARPEYLATLSASLGADQVARLYVLIRSESPQRESEFRPEFERAFARHAAALPPPLAREQVMEMLGLDEDLARRHLREETG